MPLRHLAWLLPLSILVFTLGTSFTQDAGSRVTSGSGTPRAPSPEELAPEVVERYITLEGRAEVRVDPTDLRVVLAIVSEGEDAPSCHREAAERREAFRAELKQRKIAAQDIYEDFIAILPTYMWDVEKRNGREVAVEKLSGYRLQTNLHVLVASDELAGKVREAAFAAGITDLIAVDYWNRDIDHFKREARERAIAAAMDKIEQLTTPFFKERPQICNLQEETTVLPPHRLYETFESSHSQSIDTGWRLKRDLPRISARRPRNTYYRGMGTNVDLQDERPPVRPQISVVSTVRLYLDAPGVGWVRRR